MCVIKKGNAMKKLRIVAKLNEPTKRFRQKSLDKIIDISYCEIAQFQLQGIKRLNILCYVLIYLCRNNSMVLV